MAAHARLAERVELLAELHEAAEREREARMREVEEAQRELARAVRRGGRWAAAGSAIVVALIGAISQIQVASITATARRQAEYTAERQIEQSEERDRRLVLETLRAQGLVVEGQH